MLALLAGSYVLGVETQRRGGSRAWWEIGYLGAAAFPLLGLALVSQIFHTGGSSFTLLAVWTAAILPLPFLSRSAAAFLLFLIAFTLLVLDLPEGLHWPWWHFHTVAWVMAVYGLGCALLSQLWLKLGGDVVLRNAGEYFGILVGMFFLFILGCDLSDTWFWVWLLVFAISLGLIARGYHDERIHQVNLGFGFTGLVILSIFLRLVGTMFDTGLIFIAGGLIIIGGVCGLEYLRRRLVAQIKT